MSDLNPKTFTGLLPIGPKPGDYVHGHPDNPLGGLGLREDNPTAKWTGSKPAPQVQINNVNHFQCNNCTGFGYCRNVATYLNYKLQNGQLPASFLKWMTDNKYIQNGLFAFDPRVLGILAGTTSAGNSLQKVADTGRKVGLVPAGTLPGVEACSDFPEYYNPALVTDAIKQQGLAFLQWVDLPYQWLPDNLAGTVLAGLKACPMYIGICTCGGWNTQSPVPWCNAGDATNHAVDEMETNAEVILDSFLPDIKTLATGYNVPYRMMVLTTVKTPMVPTAGYKKANSATVYIAAGNGYYVPLADWNAFLALGGNSNTIVTLSDADFALLNRVDSVLFKSK